MVTLLWRRVFLAAALALLGALWLASPAAADENAPLDLTCADATLPSDADASAEVTLPFSIDIGNADLATSIWVSENGVLTFDFDPGAWYPIFEFSNFAGFDDAYIAPLYTDAEQGAAGSVSYGATTFEGRDAFCVDWTDLEPNDPNGLLADPIPTNTFQVVLIERADRNDGSFDIVTNYESIGWDDSYCSDELNGEFGVCCAKFPPIEVNAQDEGPCCAEIIIPSAAAAAQGPGCCDIEFEGPCCDFQFDGPCCEIELEECCDIGDGIVIPCEQIPQAAAQAQPVFPDGQSAPSFAGVSFPGDGVFVDSIAIEFTGSGIIDGMIDPDGLSATSRNSLQAGRHVVEVDGANGPVGQVVGSVLLEDDSPVSNALVWVCTDPEGGDELFEDIDCAFTRTDANGAYSVDGVPLGLYEVTARGPAGSDLFDESEFVEVRFSSFANDVDPIVLFGPEQPAENVDFGPTNAWGSGTTVYYRDDLNVGLTGCSGGTATWTVSSNSGTSSGAMVEGPDGTYSGVIPALFPAHGNADVSISLTGCEDPTEDQDSSFPIYIDPSGTVLELQSREPIEGVTVVLERRDPGAIAFTQVPDGSEIMSLTNRANPFTTLDNGRFGWDVMAGEYRVTVSKDGCESIALPVEWADRALTAVEDIEGVPDASVTPILQVLPEWLGLELFLDCNNAPTIDDPGPLSLTAPVGAGDLPVPTVNDFDPDDVAGLVVTNNAPAELPIGETVVTWTVTDPSGASATVTQTVTVTAPVDDDDNDGVLNADDDCPDTVLPDMDLSQVGGGRYIATDAGFVDNTGTAVFGLDATRGCSGLQILDLVEVQPGFDETEIGLRLSTINTWIFQCSATAGVLSWDDAGQTKYWAYQSLDGGMNFSFLGSTEGETTFTVPNAQVGALYQVHFQGIDRVQCETVSEPEPGADLFACDADTGVLTWNDDDASKYWIYKSVDGGESYSWIGRTLGGTTFKDVNATVGAKYQVHYASIPRTDCTTSQEPPASNFSCSSEAGVLTWTTGAPVPTWVYRSIDGGATYSWIGRSLDAPTFTDPDPSIGALYQAHYAGIPRTDCVIVSEPPEGMAFECSVSGAEITWSDRDQDKYWVYKSVDDGATYTWIGRTLGQTTFEDLSPSGGALYQVHYDGIPRTDCTMVVEPG